MSTQKALIIPEERAPFKIVNDWPIPKPGANQVRVKILAAALNPADHRIQKFGMPMASSYPFINGLDGAGIVEELGPDVTKVAKGDKVLFPGGFLLERATFQQYNIVPELNIAKIPDNLSIDQAASVPLGLATVATGIWAHHPEANSVDFPAPWEEGGKTKFIGQAALIYGGSASVGQYAIQLARIQGFSPIITISSLKHEDYLKSLGATHVIDRSLPHADVLRKLPEITEGKSIVYAYDAISYPETQALAYDALADGGALVVTNPRSADFLKDMTKDGDGKKVARPVATLSLPGNLKLGEGLYNHITEWLATGVIVPNRIEIIPNGLAGIPEGLARIGEGKVSGVKLIARPQETP
ncbi:GroES-like protein [Dichomitus squalens]|uniref:GroES-like protein n=1 Tax=Dichomitus squalens TaxID=114155 RepID=A0A4Q9NAJ0_9APHY|nr:GroES-like protein [Dichomitus squalens]TBU51748.1 GroES-like protein [Dichomitus squalens]